MFFLKIPFIYYSVIYILSFIIKKTAYIFTICIDFFFKKFHYINATNQPNEQITNDYLTIAERKKIAELRLKRFNNQSKPKRKYTTTLYNYNNQHHESIARDWLS